jgi:hypothetical protein
VEEVDGEARVRRAPTDSPLRGLLRQGASVRDVEAEHRREVRRERTRAKRGRG